MTRLSQNFTQASCTLESTRLNLALPHPRCRAKRAFVRRHCASLGFFGTKDSITSDSFDLVHKGRYLSLLPANNISTVKVYPWMNLCCAYQRDRWAHRYTYQIRRFLKAFTGVQGVDLYKCL